MALIQAIILHLNLRKPVHTHGYKGYSGCFETYLLQFFRLYSKKKFKTSLPLPLLCQEVATHVNVPQTFRSLSQCNTTHTVVVTLLTVQLTGRQGPLVCGCPPSGSSWYCTRHHR